MKPLSSLESASNDVLDNARKLLASLRSHVIIEPNTPKDAIKKLQHIRDDTAESLNQIQHEYSIIQAVKWLQINHPELMDASWSWNPRQTGGYNEPDLVVYRQDEIMVSAEITTSTIPQGLIDSRMRDTLEKLNQMQGKKFYFVLTDAMKKRALTKVKKGGWNINIVLLHYE